MNWDGPAFRGIMTGSLLAFGALCVVEGPVWLGVVLSVLGVVDLAWTFGLPQRVCGGKG